MARLAMTVLNFPLNLEWFKKKNKKKQSESFCVQFPLQPHEGKRKKQKHKGTIYLSYCAWNEKPNTVVLPEDASAPRKEIRAPLWNFTKRCWQFYLFKKKTTYYYFVFVNTAVLRFIGVARIKEMNYMASGCLLWAAPNNMKMRTVFTRIPVPDFSSPPRRAHARPRVSAHFCGLCARQQNKRQGRPVLSLCTGTEIWKKKKEKKICRLSECCLNGP